MTIMSIQLPANATIAQVHEIKSSLMDALQTGQDLIIDLSAIEEIDMAMIQVLVALVNEAGQIAVRMTSLSWQATEAFTVFGIKHLFTSSIIDMQHC